MPASPALAVAESFAAAALDTLKAPASGSAES